MKQGTLINRETKRITAIFIKCELNRPYRRGEWGTITIVSTGPRAIRRWNTEFALALGREVLGGAWGACRVWLDTRIGRSDFKLRELLLRAVPPSSTCGMHCTLLYNNPCLRFDACNRTLKLRPSDVSSYPIKPTCGSLCKSQV